MLVIEPATPAPGAVDIAVAAHDFAGITTLGSSDELQRRAVAPGRHVRLRLVNTDNIPQTFTLDGTPFRVLAIDGTDLNAPGALDHASLRLAAGGRYDLGFTMRRAPVRLGIPDTHAALVLSPDGQGDLPPAPPGPVFDPLRYGRPATTPFGASSRFDRSFRLDIGRKPGFYDGRPGMQWTINGGIFPDVPMFVVERGDLVKLTIANHTKAVHRCTCTATTCSC